MESAEKLELFRFITQEFKLSQIVSLINLTSSVGTQFQFENLLSERKTADLIFSDYNSLSSLEKILGDKLPTIFSRKCLICIDGMTDSESISSELKKLFCPILKCPNFSIYMRVDGSRAIKSIQYQVSLFRRKYHFSRCRNDFRNALKSPRKVSVVVLTYNHEDYIEECLESVFNQVGNIRLRVIIIDDASTDQTTKIIDNFLMQNSNGNVEIVYQKNLQNKGVVSNIETGIGLAEGCDYFTFCEGDDFWSAPHRTITHIKFLEKHSDCVFSFNNIELCNADGTSREPHLEQTLYPHDTLDGVTLAASNIIGNFTACLYDGALISVIPKDLFDIYTVDWMFNLYCSQFGKIGHIKENLSVYRQHEGGEWSSRNELHKNIKLIELIDIYNYFLDFQFESGFQKYKELLVGHLHGNFKGEVEPFDIIICDDVFPSKFSGFRLAEFSTLLAEFPNAIALTSGESMNVIDDLPVDEVIKDFKRNSADVAAQLIRVKSLVPFSSTKLVYVNFLNTAFAMLPYVEASQVRLVFTLYPGGGFLLNDEVCNKKLKRIFDSPSFVKVIVTQHITYNYIVENGLCPMDKVQMIFGVVIQHQKPLVRPVNGKYRWGFGKKTLDICFMAHRHTNDGRDKGFDLFINVAKQLCQKYDDIQFHVVGPYDEHVLDVSMFKGKIKFNGVLNPNRLDSFFVGMDIIMSPNISGKIQPGSFDGFPTSSCIEAGLRSVAIFATDEFNSSQNHFIDNENIVLLHYDVAQILCKIGEYYRDPSRLREVARSGANTIKKLYGVEYQLTSRVNLLKDVIDKPFVFDFKKLNVIKSLEALDLPANKDVNFIIDNSQMPPLIRFLTKLVNIFNRTKNRTRLGNDE
jgi:glycosyltransferase involved in cell wall biosynthesis